ncbi:MAG: CDC48 family AAA ATPase [Candidatus Pacearchaeota archaeon]|jgi:transitional endoplasmic reticulum ATPase
MTDKKEVQLKVVEAQQDDAYKGIARIDSDVMRDLGIRRGDVILIKGNRETVAIADRAYPADVGEGIIRIDGILRKNSKTGIGESVKVSKAEIKEAKKVMIAPAQKNIMVQAEPENLRRGLLGRAMIKGDVVVLGGVQRRRDLFSDEFGGDFGDMLGGIGDMLGGMGFGGQLGGGFTQIKFLVISTNPSQPVVITENTEVTLNPKAVEITEESIPEITYEDIGGLSEEIKKIREMVEIPLKHPEIFEKLGVEPPKGVLLHGPPGTGKTLLAKAVANESDANFILLNGPEIMSKFYGESEKKIRDIFEEAEKTAPAIIFIDELDAIAPKREEVTGEVERRVVSQMLTLMDGLKSRGKVVVIGATNRVNSIDPALRRPGRFDREIEINVPGKEGRLSILKIHSRGMPINHWDAKIARKLLLERLTLFEGNYSEKISKMEEDLVENQKDLKSTINDEKNLSLLRDEKFMELEKKNKEFVKARIDFESGRVSQAELRRKKAEVDTLKEEIENIDNSFYKMNEKMSKLKKEIEKNGFSLPIIKQNAKIIKSRQEEITKDKILLDKILKDIESLTEVIRIRGNSDPRSILNSKELQDKSEEYSLILEDLMNQDIISEDLLDNIRRDSIPLLLDELSGPTHGFVGADLEALTKEAAMNVLRKVLPKMKLEAEEQIPKEMLEKLVIKKQDFFDSLKTVRPSAMREVLVETPTIGWEGVGGLENIKSELKEAVEWPLKHPETFIRMGIRPSRGILLYGPPGTGKTLLAKAVAKESEANFINVKGPSLLSMWVGKSEEGMRKIFERARQVAPCVIFFDEIDSLAGRRGVDSGTKVTERVLNQMLAEMDGLEDLHDILVIGATNRPDMLDPGILRPGRFDKILLVGAPEEKGRLNILEIHTKKMPIGDDKKLLTPEKRESILKELAKKTEGYTGADLEALAREAAMLALRESMDAKFVTEEHFNEAMKKIKPSVSKPLLEVYKKIEDTFIKSAKTAVPLEGSYLG